MKVLLIDDDPDVSDTVVSVLKSFFEGVEITQITDGAQFRRGEWKKGGWSLVILDLMMPGMTGFEVCEKIRATPLTAKVPVLAITGYDTLQNEEKIKAAGANGYLAKPFEIKKLREEISRLTS